MEFKQSVITKQGQELMAKLISEKVTTEFTKIVVSSTIYPDEQLENLTTIKDVKQTSTVKVNKKSETTVRVKGSIDNNDVKAGYNVQTLGLYAKDPQKGEILYMVASALKGGYIPPFNGIASTGVDFAFYVAIGNADQVEITVDATGMATVSDVVDVANTTREIEKKLKAEINTKTDKADFDGLKGRVDAHATNLGAHANLINNVNKKADDNKAKITNVEASQSNLDKRVTKIDADLKKEIDTKATKLVVDHMNTRIIECGRNVDGLKGRVDVHATNLNAHSMLINNTNKKIADVESDFKNQKIGGRNLLLNTAFRTLDRWSNTESSKATIITDDRPENSYVNTLVWTPETSAIANNLVQITKNNNANIINNQTYRCSFWAKASIKGASMRLGGITSYKNVTLDSEWKFYELDITYKESNLNRSFYIIGLVNKESYYINGLKLEKGTVTTDYSEAPEDMQEHLQTNKMIVTDSLVSQGTIEAKGGFVSIEIPVNTDLNNMKTVGFYHSPLSVHARTMKNVPEAVAFSLLVEKHAGFKQTFTTYSHNEGQTFIRNFYQNNWGPWILIGGAKTHRDGMLQIESGFVNYSDAQAPHIYRRGDVVTMHGALKNSLDIEKGWDSRKLGTLPEWARPKRAFRMLQQGTGSNLYLLIAEPNGSLMMERYRWSDNRISKESWLNLSLTYIAKDI